MSRQTYDEQIENFSRLHAPPRTSTIDVHNVNTNKSDVNSRSINSSQNGSTTPLTIEVDTKAWDLPVHEKEAEFQALIGNIRK